MNPETARALADAYESGLLPSLLSWWKNRQEAPGAKIPDKRPNISGSKGKKNTGISLDAEVLERSVTKLHRERKASGGSLSALVELLLWQYIGCPEDLLSEG